MTSQKPEKSQKSQKEEKYQYTQKEEKEEKPQKEQKEEYTHKEENPEKEEKELSEEEKRDFWKKVKDLPGYKKRGYTTLGDMKRLGLIISDKTPEELDEIEEEGLTRGKQEKQEKD